MIARSFLFTLIVLVQLKADYLYINSYNSYFIPAKIYRPKKPLMWSARLKVDYATLIGYEKKIYSYGDFLDFYGGVSGGILGKRQFNDRLFVGSCYLLFKWNFFSSGRKRFFILYSPGGPSLLSKKEFVKTAFSNYFVFQNQVGIGLSLDKSCLYEIIIKQYHYSNGDIFPVNGGIDIPLTCGIRCKF